MIEFIQIFDFKLQLFKKPITNLKVIKTQSPVLSGNIEISLILSNHWQFFYKTGKNPLVVSHLVDRPQAYVSPDFDSVRVQTCLRIKHQMFDPAVVVEHDFIAEVRTAPYLLTELVLLEAWFVLPYFQCRCNESRDDQYWVYSRMRRQDWRIVMNNLFTNAAKFIL